MVTLRPIHRKLLRDLWRMRGQLLAVAIVTMCGIATYVTMHGTYEALVRAQSGYYAGHRFADIFATLKRAPIALVGEIREIPGVADAEGRVVVDAVADVPGLDEPATVRLVSVSGTYRRGLNQVEVRRGRYVEGGAHDEVLVSEAFAAANALNPGDAIHAVINGRRERLRIVGTAISPEYVNEARGDSFPDNRRFGVVWMESRALAGSISLEDSFNDLVLTLAPRADEPAVIEALDRKLAPYGGLSARGRDEQTSHRFLQDEIAQDRVTASVLPAIFLAVAAFLVHGILLRLTTMQRGQVALMKSFGYDNVALGFFYLEFALIAVIAGSVAGIALGAWLGLELSHVYANFFRFPRLDYALTAKTALGAVAIASVSAGAGALLAIRRVVRLEPAEGLRPEAPPRFTKGLLERSGLRRVLPVALRMVLRDLMRKPVKAGISVLGIALSLALIMVGQYSFDALDEIVRVSFRAAQRDDVTIVFRELEGLGVVHEVAALPGVLRVEPFRAAPARLSFKHREKRAAINGLYPGRELRRVLDEEERPVELPAEGLVLTRRLADVLAAGTGDRVTVEFLDARKRTVTLEVARIVDEMIGAPAYMDARALAAAMLEGESVSGAYLAVDPALRPALYRQLKSTPGVGGVFLRESTLESFLKTVAENLYISTGILVMFACAIAAGVIYSTARISLSEQAVELASLRILGFSRAAAGRLLLGQQALITLAALPLGCVIGYLVALWLSHLLSNDLFRLPIVISTRTFALSIGMVLAATALSAALVRRHVWRLDLIEVLKTRE